MSSKDLIDMKGTPRKKSLSNEEAKTSSRTNILEKSDYLTTSEQKISLIHERVL